MVWRGHRGSCLSLTADQEGRREAAVCCSPSTPQTRVSSVSSSWGLCTAAQMTSRNWKLSASHPLLTIEQPLTHTLSPDWDHPGLRKVQGAGEREQLHLNLLEYLSCTWILLPLPETFQVVKNILALESSVLAEKEPGFGGASSVENFRYSTDAHLKCVYVLV